MPSIRLLVPNLNRLPVLFSRNFSYGQPCPTSHPHLLLKDEIQPGITKNMFAARRERLVNLISDHVSKKVSGIKSFSVVLPSSTILYSAKGIPHDFVQNSDFLYFTGFNEPDSTLVLKKSLSDSDFSTTLFVKENNDFDLTWSGSVTGSKQAPNLLGIADSHSNKDLAPYLQDLFKQSSHASFYNGDDEIIPSDSDHVTTIRSSYVDNQFPMANLFQPSNFYHILRVVKEPAEQELMRKSCQIMADSLKQVISQHSYPNVPERHIDAALKYNMIINGAHTRSFPPIAAGGNRSTVLHYLRNDAIITSSDNTVLVDTGCSYAGYCSDITRTYPVTGRFTNLQLDVYERLHKVHTHCIGLVRPGISLDSIHNEFIKHLAQDVVIPLVFGPSGCTLSKAQQMVFASKLCPHHVGHYLGLDVHDCPTFARSHSLREGMVITIEPGVYFAEHSPVTQFLKGATMARYRELVGIGIRIEDDVLLTELGHENLTKTLPSDAAGLTALIKDGASEGEPQRRVRSS